MDDIQTDNDIIFRNGKMCRVLSTVSINKKIINPNHKPMGK